MKTMTRSAAAALALCLLLGGCGATATSAPESYDYLAEFDFSAPFDENGYAVDVTALDYVTLPEDVEHLTVPAGQMPDEEQTVSDFIDNYVIPGLTITDPITDRAAEIGDFVNIDYVGSVDGVEFEGGNSGGNGSVLKLGSHSFIDDFEEQIAGHTPGEEFDVNVTFPDPYPNNPDLAGKEAVFVTTLHSILPPLDDATVEENLGANMDLHTVQQLRDYIYEGEVVPQKINVLYSQLRADVTYAEPLAEKLTQYFTDCVLYPKYQQYPDGLAEGLAEEGYESVDAYLEAMQDTVDSYVRQVLLVQAVAEKLGIVCDDDALESGMADGLDSSYEQTYGRNYLKMILLQDLTMETLLENANIEAE